MGEIKPLAVYELTDLAGYLVRGTDDPELAMNAVLDEGYYEDVALDSEVDLEPEPDVARAGWFRFNPCHPNMCSEGHAWHTGYASGPGQGNFRGVLLHVAFREVVYDGDPMPKGGAGVVLVLG